MLDRYRSIVANWSYPTAIRFGPGRIAELPLALGLAGIARPLFVTDPKAGEKTKYTIIIPNTVGLIRGCQHKAEARQLADFLLSAQTELALARSKSRQIPLGPVDPQQVPAEVRELAQSVPQGYDLRTLETARRECIEWLKSESLR